MGRYSRIADDVVRSFLAKDRPSDLFHSLFFDLREKIRALKQKMAEDIRGQIEKQLREDIQKQGYDLVSLDVKLGRYRGSEFVTSARTTVKSKGTAADRELVKFLQEKHHPNFQNKGETDGNVVLNIR